MNNLAIKIKVKQRLNKLASNDYDNIEPWKISEAFNKGMLSWVRRNLHGTNMLKEGDEGSTKRIDDLQILLTDYKIPMFSKDGYYESNALPENYMSWKRVTPKAIKGCCTEPRKMKTYLVPEADIDLINDDEHKRPSFEWSETVCTLIGNKLRVHTNNLFQVTDTNLLYYRFPVFIQFLGSVDPYTGLPSTSNVECEFKNDLVEVLIDECVKILAGDIESITQQDIASGSVETNN